MTHAAVRIAVIQSLLCCVQSNQKKNECGDRINRGKHKLIESAY